MSDAREAALAAGAAVSGGAGLLASMFEGVEIAGWIERIGLPTAALLAIGWLVVRFARWCGEHVVRPVVAKHVAFVDAVSQATTAQAETLRQTQACVERMEHSEAARERTAAEERACAAEERKTTRLAVEGVREAIDRLGRALDSTPVNGRPAA